MNDDMVVVIKQNGKIINPASSEKGSENVVGIDYFTGKLFKFTLSSLRFNQPFTVILANMADGNPETSWIGDPSAIR